MIFSWVHADAGSDELQRAWGDLIVKAHAALGDGRFGWDTGYPIATVNAEGKIVVCYWMKTKNQDEPNYIAATIWDVAGPQ